MKSQLLAGLGIYGIAFLVSCSQPPVPVVNGLVLSPSSNQQMTIEDSLDVQATVQIQNSTNNKINWDVNPLSNTKLTPKGTGVVFSATAAGDYVLTASSDLDATKKSSINIKVTPALAVSLNYSGTQELALDRKLNFKATIVNATNSQLEWNISPAGQLQVSGDSAEFIPSALGDYTITVKSVQKPEKQAKVIVRVVKPIVVSVDVPPTLSLNPNQSTTLLAQISNASNTNLLWSASPSTGLEIVPSATGATLTAKTVGRYTVTVKSQQDPSRIYTFVVVVSGWSTTVQIGSAANEEARTVLSGSDGSLFLAGFTQGDLDANSNTGAWDAFVSKVDTNGQKLWTKLLGGSGFEVIYQLAQNSTGDLYAVGYSSGAVDGQTSHGNNDILLAKFDASGNKQWTKLLGTAGNDIGRSISLDGNGNVYIAGETTGDLNSELNSGSQDGFIMKLDPSGAVLWTKLIGTADNDAAWTVKVSGNYSYVGGYLSSQAMIFIEDSAATDGFFKVFSNDTGKALITERLSSSSADAVRGLDLDASDNMYVTGFSKGALAGLTPSGKKDVFVIKYNASFAQQWVKTIASVENEDAYAIKATPAGNVVVVGATEGTLSGQTALGSTDAFVTQFSGTGDLMWQHQIGSTGVDIAMSTAVDTGNSVYVAGSTEGSLDTANQGGQDAFVTKYDASGVKQ